MKLNIIIFFICGFVINGIGQIGFEEQVITSISQAPNHPTSIYSVDLDGDGDMDVLCSSKEDDKIAWYENTDGQGNFGPQQIISTDVADAQSIYSADIDNDGDMDVLSASEYDDKIAWYENTDGQGNFGNEQIISTQANGVLDVTATDLDGDGDLDVIAALSSNNRIVWYENIDGLGTFGAQNNISSNLDFYLRSVKTADIDGDGDMDILFATSENSTIAWYENTDGQGNFGPKQTIVVNSIYAKDVTAADLDGDGDLDVVTGFSDGGSESFITWFENMDGLGAFGSQQTIEFSQDHQLVALDASDIDGDGDIDISAAYNQETPNLVWFENEDGQGAFSSYQEITIDYELGASSVFLVDIDNDGDIDALSASNSDDAIIGWNENTNGLGEFGPQNIIIANYSLSIASLFPTDLDGDNDLDLLSTSVYPAKVNWLENLDGLGGFSFPQGITTSAQYPSSIVAGDIDNDGDMDIVLVEDNDDKISWIENTDGQGTLSTPQIITTESGGSNDIYLVDVDSDNDLDIISLAWQNFDVILWYENTNGQGNFSTANAVLDANVLYSIGSFYPKDFDGDGDIDVLYATSDNQIIWVENTDGQGSFGTEQIIATTSEFLTSVHGSDINGDGNIDVLYSYSSYGLSPIFWKENLGQGVFGPDQLITEETQYLRFFSSTDLDNDGDKDVLVSTTVVGSNPGTIAWLENTDGQGGFGPIQTISSNSNNNFQHLKAIDINNDGNLDLLATVAQESKIVWYESLGLLNNEIKGFAKLDINANDCVDPDIPLENIMVMTTDGTNELASFSLSNGFYQLFPSSGEYTTTLNLPDYYTVNPNSYTSNFTGSGAIEMADFCIAANQSVNDLNISLYPTSEARAGFEASYQLVYSNVGTTSLSGDINLNFDNEKMSFSSASEPPSSQNNNTLTFDYSDLNPFETRTIDLTYYIFTPPTVNLDDTLSFTTTINPVQEDFTAADNQFNFDQLVIGSYDPNDITVIEGEEILLEEATNYLHYIIRFQNTGTADAINVRVRNTLDINLDWQTLQLESLSHEGYVDIADGNNVSFIFDDIHLPDSTNNEPESHGFITYKIKPKSDIALGDSISNQANIFFDFNPPVETNTVITQIVALPKVDENTISDSSVSAHPNPTSDVLTIDSKASPEVIEIYSIAGDLILSKNKANSIDISKLSTGLYLCKVVDVDGNSRVIKIVRK